MTTDGKTGDRRARVRQETLAEIRATARKLLVAKGPAAVTVNAVAREMGVSGPALYRYFTGHDQLADELTADFYRDLTAAVEAARDSVGADTSDRRLLAMSRALRAWAVGNPAEFGWIFTRVAMPAAERAGAPSMLAGEDFERVLRDEFVRLWRTRPFAVPDLDRLAPSLREQLGAYSEGIGGALPPAAAHVFLTSWIRLYGLLCMEVLHQLDFVFTDVEPLFEEALREICDRLGVVYEPA
ncbi:TetR/AcrR family transcriptional regulator [Phytomonospora sp. NPDC050363]|uniref:TetR/AcrR family transcriptional regulator n=1 Tax=Phytomonospora sp. NPDC050363 TaxID=3155642 RepID=UPI003406821E